MRYLAMIPALLAATANAAQSHCTRQEQVIFSCTIARTQKVLSLCASGPLAKGQGSLAYRFGPPGKTELQFPPSPEGSLARFRYAHYFRYRVDMTEISFTIGNTVYSVFDDYDGAQRPRRARGVRVSSEDGKGREAELLCTEPATSELFRLNGILPCETGDALAGCDGR